MEYQGQSLTAIPLGRSGIYEVCFDRKGQSVNKLDDQTVLEFRDAIRWLACQSLLRGILVTSRKESFIVGADIGEFGRKFNMAAAEIAADLAANSSAFTEFEDLPVPTVVAINGYALGGGLEMALAGSIRIIAEPARIAVPEVKLGIFPGYGGTVRLLRIAGPAVAAEWVSMGNQVGSARALSAGVVDAVADPSDLRNVALDWLQRSIAGEVDWIGRQQRKREPLRLAPDDLAREFAAARENLQESRHQPAARMALSMMERGALLDRDQALLLEAEVFGSVARTQAARSMTQVFMDDQVVKKQARRHAAGAKIVRNVALLGAGAMGRGIAYSSAAAGVNVRIDEVSHTALESGIKGVCGQVARQVSSGRLDEAKAEAMLRAISPMLDDSSLNISDMVIEAINEQLEEKQAALSRAEMLVREDTILATNTSSFKVEDVAKALKRPQNLVGMHFFNPAPSMQLVEVVRGVATSGDVVAAAVAYAIALGKTPVVVRDCAGFLVNRLFTAYIRAFLQLVADGANFEDIDRVMEDFGWPTGPAALVDLIGIDVGSHVNNVVSAAYSDRMPQLGEDALQLLTKAARYGRKSNMGFYQYEVNERGRLRRSASQDSMKILSALQSSGSQSFTDEEILDRMMLPVVIEASIALEEGVVATAAELDAATRLGLGFPLHAGGPLMYADWIGLREVVNRSSKLIHLGPAYVASTRIVSMANSGETFH